MGGEPVIKEVEEMKGKKIFGFGFMSILLMASPLLAAGPENILKVGIVAPLTGAGAPWGLAWQKSAQLIAEQYNAAGGITVQGQQYKIEVIAEDDKMSPSEAVTVTNKLIHKDNVRFIMGSIGSASVMATRPITESNKVITIHSCYTPKAIAPELPFTFRHSSSMGETIGPMFKWAKEKYPNLKKIAVLGPNDESGWSINAEYILKSKKVGFEVVAEDYFERNTNDFYPVLTRMLKNQPDILMLSGGTGDTALILKQAKQMGYKGLTLSSAGHDAGKLCKAAGKTFAEGHIHSGLHILPGRLQKWHDEYKARWKEWDDTSSLGTSLDIIVEGIRKADSLDTTKVRNAIEIMDYDSRIVGPCKFGGKKRYGIAHQLLSPVFVSQVKNCANMGLALVPPVEPDPPPAEVKKK
jgi:branched-chain amino acid transport system substrate-binding protein